MNRTRLTIRPESKMIAVPLSIYEPMHDPDPYDLAPTWDFMREMLDVSEETLQVVTAINGYRLDVLEDVLCTLTGCKSFDQLTWEMYANYRHPFKH